MKLNPTAVVLWAFLSLGSYLVFGTLHAAAVGLLLGLGVSLLVGDLL